MAREMREEEARNSLVYFTDVQDGKDIRGFGIEIGQGLSLRVKQIWCRLEEHSSFLVLDELSPLITIRRISYEQMLLCGQYIFNLSSQYVDPVIDDTGWRGNILDDMRLNSVFNIIDGTNRLISSLRPLVQQPVLYAYEENLIERK